MSYHCFESTERKARKAHKCIWCGEMIQPQETYQYESGNYDGEFQSNHFHPECARANRAFFLSYDETDFEAYGFKRGTMDER